MKNKIEISFWEKTKLFLIGKGRNLKDDNIFHRMTLIAFFAWIGLGSDGLSSSCYGPEESYRALGGYHHLTVFVAIAIVLTIFIISTSYSQIIKLFPSGGGGYRVATKLLSPNLGMISGCSLIVDYILTIAISIASGTDALFSFLPPQYHYLKIFVTVSGIVVLILLNLRGIKESVFSLMPIFIIFVLSHIFLITYSLFSHVNEMGTVIHGSILELHQARKSLGMFGVMALIMRSYSMGAGTYTGLEAVSNSVPILKEPRVKTGLVTMRYMAFSLAITVLGLFIAYSLFEVQPSATKTLNAVLLENFTSQWSSGIATVFILITLISEAALLFVAAQTGFLDGPRVIASMASDNWFPRKFAVLSDRLVTSNGIVFMGIMAIIMLLLTGGAVNILIVLYSINVFVTFALSQAGMVRHWWLERKTIKSWKSKLMINFIGLSLTLFILIMVVTIKFKEGGWVTILITSALVFLVTRIKKHYNYAGKLIGRFNTKVFGQVDEILSTERHTISKSFSFDTERETAAVCVSGYNGLGIDTFFRITERFNEFKNIIFIEVGMVDAANFRGEEELERLENQVKSDLDKYQKLAEHFGYFSECYHSIGTDIADEVKELSKKVMNKYINTTFFVGQFILPKSTALQRSLHNQTQYAIQNRLSHKGFIMVMIPIRFYEHL
ncbi:MAG: APC family permease [Bacteroidota bacterium]|nr:APC family permease [Bacteroidota bacterium]